MTKNQFRDEVVELRKDLTLFLRDEPDHVVFVHEIGDKVKKLVEKCKPVEKPVVKEEKPKEESKKEEPKKVEVKVEQKKEDK